MPILDATFDTLRSVVAQTAGRTFLSVVFVTSEILIQADLAARAAWSYVTGPSAAPRPAPLRRCAITDRSRRASGTAAVAAKIVRSTCNGPRSVAC